MVNRGTNAFSRTRTKNRSVRSATAAAVCLREFASAASNPCTTRSPHVIMPKSRRTQGIQTAGVCTAVLNVARSHSMELRPSVSSQSVNDSQHDGPERFSSSTPSSPRSDTSSHTSDLRPSLPHMSSMPKMEDLRELTDPRVLVPVWNVLSVEVEPTDPMDTRRDCDPAVERRLALPALSNPPPIMTFSGASSDPTPLLEWLETGS
mmetsp:Transcript_23304/g.49846  ORF Transcript_23304/g.49846 Transcript_23304/m.49846 type:complete len:206 (+) Transcript_23304:1495-2112(+)